MSNYISYDLSGLKSTNDDTEWNFDTYLFMLATIAIIELQSLPICFKESIPIIIVGFSNNESSIKFHGEPPVFATI